MKLGIRIAAAAVTALLPALVHAEGLDSGDTAWMLTSTALVLFMTLPGLAILFAVLGFNLLGDGLRDALDPRLRD